MTDTVPDDLPRRADGEVDFSSIFQGLDGLRRRINRSSDLINEVKDRLDVREVHARYMGTENEGQIELPTEEDDIDVLHSNWADEQTMTSDTQFTDE